MNQVHIEAQAQTTDLASFRTRLISFAHDLGFGTVSAMAVTDRLIGDPVFVGFNNVPSAYLEDFHDPAVYRCDPVMQHCKTRNIPIVWNQLTYTSQALGCQWERQAQHGMASGVALALHLPEGKHFFIGLDSDFDVHERPLQLSRIIGELHRFASCAVESALHLMAPNLTEPIRRLRLTPREMEALYWTMEGKTAWEVGNILNISERTAVSHMASATRKLGCINKHQAVVKAIRLGILR
jgi:DNA-binding CsgD family transcriptional regulator